jgi:hypothetical protein
MIRATPPKGGYAKLKGLKRFMLGIPNVNASQLPGLELNSTRPHLKRQVGFNYKGVCNG